MPRSMLAFFLCLHNTFCLSEEANVNDWVNLPLSVSKATFEAVLSVPKVMLAKGFKSEVLVSTKRGLFDPFDFHVVDDDRIWVADDGRNGAIFEITLDGQTRLISYIQKHAPYAIDVAPSGFGGHTGKIYAIAFAKPEKAGGWELPNAITRIDPVSGNDEVVCFLPENAEKKPGAGGFFARFGPIGSPFEGRLWITAASNHTIYTVDPSDACQPFKTLDLMVEGSPRSITFSEDGDKMLLGVTAPGLSNRNKTQLGGGRILIMDATGTIEKLPFSKGLHEPGAMTFAPQTFGRFGGSLIVSDAGEWDNDFVATEPISRDGMIYAINNQGVVETLVEGLANPVGVGFIGGALIASDINGDFHVGTQKFADGFILKIEER